MISANIQENIKSHLQMLAGEFNRNFQEYNQKPNLKLTKNGFVALLVLMLETLQKNPGAR